MTIHSAMTGSQLHENKGVETANADEVATADGSGNTVWKKLTTDNFSSTIGGLGKGIISAYLADISTAQKLYIPVKDDIEVTDVVICVSAPITVANATITVKDSSGATMVAIPVDYTTAAAGDVDSNAVTVNNAVTGGDFFTVETDGGSTSTSPMNITIYFDYV